MTPLTESALEIIDGWRAFIKAHPDHRRWPTPVEQARFRIFMARRRQEAGQ